MRRVLVRATTIVALCSSAPSFAQVVLTSAHGTAANEWFGLAVDFAGDVDGDGIGDVIVGAPQDNTAFAKAGKARVLSGATGATLLSWTGDSAGDLFGSSVAGLGDVNLDGVVDVIVGADLDDVGATDSGTARVYSGANGAVLYAFSGGLADDSLGAAVGRAGDFDLDGRADFIVASHHLNAALHHAGGVFVRSGANGSALLSLFGTAVAQDLGHSVALAGDIDHDGTDDLIVGAHGWNQNGNGAGGAFFYSGATGQKLFTFSGDNAFDDMGRSAAAAGDVDQDGFPDAIVGIPGDDNLGADAGAARVFSGKTGAVLFQFDGNGVGDQLGQSVFGGFDYDGDAVPDLVVGVPGDDDAGSNTGSVRIHSGATGALVHQVNGSTSGVRIWRALAGGDVDADGHADLVVGIPYDDAPLSDSGTVLVYSGDQLGWSDLGQGLAGAFGTPQLTGDGYLEPTTPTTFAVAQAAPTTPLAFVVGIAQLNAPLYGGTFVPTPNLILTGLFTDAGGSFALTTPWPPGLPSGVPLYSQVWLVDPTGPQGHTATNAVRFVAP